MRRLILSASIVALMIASHAANAGPYPAARLSGADGLPSIVLVQNTQKSEPLTQKVKRIWRNWTGYKFNVACPFAAQTTCTATGKSRADARSKWISQHNFCIITDADR